jgi:hypothetical protein
MDTVVKPKVEHLEQPPADWFVLDVMRSDQNPRGRDWSALMISVDPDELKSCTCDFPARLSRSLSPWETHGTPMLGPNCRQAQKPDRCLECLAEHDCHASLKAPAGGDSQSPPVDAGGFFLRGSIFAP